MEEIKKVIDGFSTALSTFSVTDAIDIILVALLIYSVLMLIRTTSAARIAKAIVFILLITLLSDVLRLLTFNYLLERFLELGIIAIVIVFQPELRRLLEKVGGSSLRSLSGKGLRTVDIQLALREVVEACKNMSESRTGALIVFERSNSLEQVCKTGTAVNADVSQELIRNIFFPKAALHDGAMIIRSNRIACAGCVLPLSENRKINSDLGTRHRAGLGMSEQSDALVVIVSEETGAISVAVEGMLKRHIAPETLERMLTNEFVSQESGKGGLFGLFKKQKKEDDRNEKA